MSGNQVFIILLVGIIAAAVVLNRLIDAIGGRRKDSGKDGPE